MSCKRCRSETVSGSRLGPGAHSFTGKERLKIAPDLNAYMKRSGRGPRPSWRAESRDGICIKGQGSGEPQTANAFFQEEETSHAPDIFIGAMRILKYQGFSLFRRSLTVDQFKNFKRKLEDFEKKDWVILLSDGFQLTKKGILFLDLPTFRTLCYLSPFWDSPFEQQQK